MARQVYKEYNQGEILLFPPSIESMVPQDSPARLVDYVIQQLDIHELLGNKGDGTSSYHPRMLLNVIFFAYMNNVYSCRKIARQLRENVLYIWLAGGQHMRHTGSSTKTNEHGFKSYTDHYKAANCQGCPLRSKCHTAKGNRMIAVNHRLDLLRCEARELLMSEEGLRHRSRRPIEPEAVFGQMKFNMGHKRFRHVGEKLCNMDFGIFAIAFNLLKLSRLKGFKWDDFLRRMRFIAFLCRYLIRGKLKLSNLIEWNVVGKLKMPHKIIRDRLAFGTASFFYKKHNF